MKHPPGQQALSTGVNHPAGIQSRRAFLPEMDQPPPPAGPRGSLPDLPVHL